ncbi:hypothetical protein [Lacunimicrobium album]
MHRPDREESHRTGEGIAEADEFQRVVNVNSIITPLTIAIGMTWKNSNGSQKGNMEVFLMKW